MFELFRKKEKKVPLTTEIMELSENSKIIYNNTEIVLESIKEKRFSFTLDISRSNYNFAYNLNSKLKTLDYRLKELGSKNNEIYKELEMYKYKTYLLTDCLKDLIEFNTIDIEDNEYFYYLLVGCKDILSNLMVFLNNLFNYINNLVK
ncbi:MAG: hypothetical protein ACRCTZ_05840 [Sarcina sp.]